VSTASPLGAAPAATDWIGAFGLEHIRMLPVLPGVQNA
jgi:hypothetical protein